MSFKFPSLKSIQDSLPKVDLDNISKSLSNTGKTVQTYGDQLKENLQPLTAKTTLLISSQLQQVQQLAATHTNSNIEVSELPADYLQLENHCDLLLKLYTDLIHFNSETYAKVSYDYPPGNYAITKIKDAQVGSIIGSKFNQLKNVSSPQELEKILLGGAEEETVAVQTTSAKLPKTLFGQLSTIASKHGDELKELNEALSFVLLQASSTYLEIASARLEQDDKIIANVNQQLVATLNEQFIKVNELRKKVYAARSEFDLIRSKSEDDEENDELIAKEDDLVSATEVAVAEMKKLLKPLKNVNLLKVFVAAQKDFHDVAAKKLSALSDSLNKLEVDDEDYE